MKLIIPHITEKSYQGYADTKASFATYTFRVKPEVDKGLVKRLVEKQYKVHVVDVRIVNLPGKIRKFKNIAGQTKVRCKAIVRLRAGERIADFEVEAKEAADSKE